MVDLEGALEENQPENYLATLSLIIPIILTPIIFICNVQ